MTPLEQHRGRFHLLSVLAVLTVTGCGAEADPWMSADGPLGTTAVSFEEFERHTYREPDTGIYIVEGDMPLLDVQALREYYESLPKSGGLILNQENGADTKWNSTQKLNLTYCVSTSSFGSDYATAVAVMEQAANAWESAANVNFSHVASQDGACDASNPNVVFDVNMVANPPYSARTFFPNAPRASRNVLISHQLFAPEYITYRIGVIQHELGHALGFRHEHIRPESGATNTDCIEDTSWRPLTPYDSASVMHYSYCGGSNQGDYHLTQRDRVAVRALYGRGNGNLALIATSTASSTYCPNSLDCYSAFRVNDRSRDTALSSSQSWTNAQGAALPQWVELNLGQYQVVDSATVYSSSGGVVQNYDLEAYDGWGWLPVAHVTGNTLVQRSHTFTPIAAKKFRLMGYMGSATQPGYIRVNELELYNSHENLALGSTASASSTYCTATDCYAAWRINDGLPSTALGGGASWTNDGVAALPQWTELNFGGPRTFGRVTVYLTSGYIAQDYSLQYWSGSAWVTLVSVTGNTQVQRSHTFTPVTATRLRFLGQKGSTSQPQYVRLNELEIYEN